jgi:hypothetical protein
LRAVFVFATIAQRRHIDANKWGIHMSPWQKKRLLLIAKTYPQWSSRYYETVCCGAIDSETRRLVRIYPLPLRHMQHADGEPFDLTLFSWMDVSGKPNDSDPRPESFKIRIEPEHITEGELIKANAEGWEERRRWTFGQQTVFPSYPALQAAQEANRTSLGFLKPRDVRRVYVEECNASERAEWESRRDRARAQGELYTDGPMARELEFVPVRYKIAFTCQQGTPHDCWILDWGTYVLHRKMVEKYGDDAGAAKVIQEIEKRLDMENNDPHLLMGNTLDHPKNFSVAGIISPPRRGQTLLGF